MSLTRRRFLKTVVVSAGAVALTQVTGCLPISNKQAEELRAKLFPQSLASGDPRPSSVVLWTRLELDRPDLPPQELVLQVATDKHFKRVIVDQKVTVASEHDFCAKVRVTQLSPDTRYYYRFIYLGLASNVGRTRTAPALDSQRKVKFAYVSCQDYNGRYYNLYLRLLEQDMDDLDFVVHLGDYIYETDRNPSFQTTSADRQVLFTDTAGAIAMSSNGQTYYAARSLDNYRQLYKTYRGDSVLQQIHEKFPMIAIWDDHEFSDDCWQCNGTYYDGVKGEGDIERRRNCEQAYFEYMPIDQESVAGAVANTTAAIDTLAGELSQGSVDSATGVGTISNPATIYRSMRFGQHVELFLTDYRTIRPDHVIPEDAFPGSVIFNAGVNDPSGALDYVELGTLTPTTQGTLQAVFLQMYQCEYAGAGFTAAEAGAKATAKVAEVLTGKLSAAYLLTVISAVVAQGGLTSTQGSALQADIGGNIAGHDGISYYSLGKGGLFSHLGSRYLTVKPTFDALAAYVYQTNKSALNAYGDTQFQWLTQGFSESNATWRVLASSVSMTKMVMGLKSTLPASQLSQLPVQLQNDFYLDLDQWDGFAPFRDNDLFPAMMATDNSPNGVVTIAGDIHSSWVSDHGEGRVVFTGSSITSETLHGLLSHQVSGLADMLAGGDATKKAELIQLVGALLSNGDQILTQSNSDVKLARIDQHGLNVVEADADGFNVTFYQLESTVGGLDMIGVSYYDSPSTVLDNIFTYRFQVANNYLSQL
ncbi:alkaline phosphatase D family protein [Mangrovitalea sediminis]|uniref:alkaline phosphatase D family protein n=1 Tax=Mangrovitalea sediminis TaxID=1982043 RepID=UPI000BE5FF9A|nr:alkaline phosphatase D family protein [Mangrovitalea sediminis]